MASCVGILFAHSCDISTHVTEYCAVIGPALCSRAHQTVVKEVTSLVEWGVAMKDYDFTGI